MQRIFPAILTADPNDLKAKLEILKGMVDWVHIDIADGKFVPNTTIALFELGEAYQYFNLEIHLMVEHPENYFEDCKATGAKRVIFHFEAPTDRKDTLKAAGKYGFQKGIALNPETKADAIRPFIARIDSVLSMGVHPGFQGRQFIPETLQRIPEIRSMSSKILVGADGGIKELNIKDVFEAGADYAVIGSGIWETRDPKETLMRFQDVVQ